MLATYSYDSLGRSSNVAFGNGTSQALAFDNAGRLTTLATNLANTAHDVQTTFAYDPANQIASNASNHGSHTRKGRHEAGRARASTDKPVH